MTFIKYTCKVCLNEYLQCIGLLKEEIQFKLHKMSRNTQDMFQLCHITEGRGVLSVQFLFHK